MSIIFDEVVANVDSPTRGGPAAAGGAGGAEAPHDRDDAQLLRIRAVQRLIEERSIRLRAT